MTSVRHWETQTLRLTFRPKMRAGGLQEDVITSNASQMEEAESSDGGGCRNNLEDNGLGYLRWRRSRFESTSIEVFTRGAMWDTPVARWAGEGVSWLGTENDARPAVEGRRDCLMRQLTAHLMKKPGSIPSQDTRDFHPLVLKPQANTEGIEFRGDSKNVVAWINGKAKQKMAVGAVGGCPETTEGIVVQRRRFTQKS